MADKDAWSLGTRAKLVALIVSMTVLLIVGFWMAWEEPSDTEAWSTMVVGAAGVAIYARVVGALRRSRLLAVVVASYAVVGFLASAAFWFVVIRYARLQFRLEFLITTFLSFSLLFDAPFIVRDAVSPRRDNVMSKDD